MKKPISLPFTIRIVAGLSLSSCITHYKKQYVYPEEGGNTGTDHWQTGKKISREAETKNFPDDWVGEDHGTDIFPEVKANKVGKDKGEEVLIRR